MESYTFFIQIWSHSEFIAKQATLILTNILNSIYFLLLVLFEDTKFIT